MRMWGARRKECITCRPLRSLKDIVLRLRSFLASAQNTHCSLVQYLIYILTDPITCFSLLDPDECTVRHLAPSRIFTLELESVRPHFLAHFRPPGVLRENGGI
jgi:hypothetical protein